MDVVFERIDQECEKLDLTDIEGEPLIESNNNDESIADDTSGIEESGVESKESLDAELDTSIDTETTNKPDAAIEAEAVIETETPELAVVEEVNTEEALVEETVEEAIEETVEETIEDTATDNQNDLSAEDDVT